MQHSRMLVSIFVLFTLLLTACQTAGTPTPEAAIPPPTKDAPEPASTLPPTDVPTTTPAEVALEPDQCIELIENGGFESGSLEPWILNSNLGNTGIADFRPGGGKYSVVLGDVNGMNADERLEIEVAIPANAATASLSFRADFITQETGSQSQDALNISVQTPDGQITGLFRLDTTKPLESPQRVVDMAPYIGQTFVLFFHAQTDAQNRTDFSVDDVILEACGPEVVAATQPAQAAGSPADTTLGQGQCIELIQNGDFEIGSPIPWAEKSNRVLMTEFSSERGKYLIFMGGGPSVEEMIAQDVQIPAGAASVTLTYWWMHGGREETDGQAHDFMRVKLYDKAGTELVLIEEISNITPPNREFAQSTQDLTAYTGQNVRLAFEVTTDAQNDSDFFLDDVSLQACGPQ